VCDSLLTRKHRLQAFESAATLVDALRRRGADGNVRSCLQAYSDHQRKDEAAYAFFARPKTLAERAACSVGAALGLHRGRAGKDTVERYSEITAMPEHMAAIECAMATAAAVFAAAAAAAAAAAVTSRRPLQGDFPLA
jgi:hypothetical protein